MESLLPASPRGATADVCPGALVSPTDNLAGPTSHPEWAARENFPNHGQSFLAQRSLRKAATEERASLLSEPVQSLLGAGGCWQNAAGTWRLRYSSRKYDRLILGASPLVAALRTTRDDDARDVREHELHG